MSAVRNDALTVMQHLRQAANNWERVADSIRDDRQGSGDLRSAANDMRNAANKLARFLARTNPEHPRVRMEAQP